MQIVRGQEVPIVELDRGYAVCGLKNLYLIMDANDMRYVNRTDVRTHAQTKFSIEHTSVGLAHARPMNLRRFTIRILSYVLHRRGDASPHSL